MKRLILAASVAVLVSCGGVSCPEGEHRDCETTYEYRYGYNIMNGKYEFSYGPDTDCWCEI